MVKLCNTIGSHWLVGKYSFPSSVTFYFPTVSVALFRWFTALSRVPSNYLSSLCPFEWFVIRAKITISLRSNHALISEPIQATEKSTANNQLAHPVLQKTLHIHRVSAGASRTLAHAHFNCLLSCLLPVSRRLCPLPTFYLSSRVTRSGNSLLENVTVHKLTLVLRYIYIEPLSCVHPEHFPYFVLREFFSLREKRHF
mgnify:CR=1 FL=1